MGNSILAGIPTFIPIFQPMALAQEKPTSPPAEPAPAPAPAQATREAPIAFTLVVDYRPTPIARQRALRYQLPQGPPKDGKKQEAGTNPA